MWACGTVTAGKTGLEHYIIIMTQENGLGRKTALTRLTEGFTRHQVVLLVNPFTPSLPLPSLSLALSLPPTPSLSPCSSLPPLSLSAFLSVCLSVCLCLSLPLSLTHIDYWEKRAFVLIIIIKTAAGELSNRVSRRDLRGIGSSCW